MMSDEQTEARNRLADEMDRLLADPSVWDSSQVIAALLSDVSLLMEALGGEKEYTETQLTISAPIHRVAPSSSRYVRWVLPWQEVTDE